MSGNVRKCPSFGKLGVSVWGRFGGASLVGFMSFGCRFWSVSVGFFACQNRQLPAGLGLADFEGRTLFLRRLAVVAANFFRRRRPGVAGTDRRGLTRTASRVASTRG